MDKKQVLIAMSGGVDSSAAALLVQSSGHACAGGIMKLYGNKESGIPETSVRYSP